MTAAATLARRPARKTVPAEISYVSPAAERPHYYAMRGVAYRFKD